MPGRRGKSNYLAGQERGKEERERFLLLSEGKRGGVLSTPGEKKKGAELFYFHPPTTSKRGKEKHRPRTSRPKKEGNVAIFFTSFPTSYPI